MSRNCREGLEETLLDGVAYKSAIINFFLVLFCCCCSFLRDRLTGGSYIAIFLMIEQSPLGI